MQQGFAAHFRRSGLTAWSKFIRTWMYLAQLSKWIMSRIASVNRNSAALPDSVVPVKSWHHLRGFCCLCRTEMNILASLCESKHGSRWVTAEQKNECRHKCVFFCNVCPSSAVSAGKSNKQTIAGRQELFFTASLGFVWNARWGCLLRLWEPTPECHSQATSLLSCINWT